MKKIIAATLMVALVAAVSGLIAVVDVHNPALVALAEPRGEDLHEAGQDHEGRSSPGPNSESGTPSESACWVSRSARSTSPSLRAVRAERVN